MFATRLKNLREESSLSQKAFSDVLGIAQSTYALYETGKREPNIDTLCKIADYFGVSADYLLGKAECKKPTDESVCKRFGISENAIEALDKIKANGLSGALELFVESDITRIFLLASLKELALMYEQKLENSVDATIANLSWNEQKEKRFNELKNEIESIYGPMVILDTDEYISFVKKRAEEHFKHLIDAICPYDLPSGDNHIKEFDKLIATKIKAAGDEILKKEATEAGYYGNIETENT